MCYHNLFEKYTALGNADNEWLQCYLLLEKHHCIKHTWLFYNIRSVTYGNKCYEKPTLKFILKFRFVQTDNSWFSTSVSQSVFHFSVEIHKERSNKMQQRIKFYYSIFIWAQHVSGDTPPIIRSLKLHWQPLVFHTWKVVCTCSWWTLSGTVYCAWHKFCWCCWAVARPRPTALLPPRSNGKTRGCYCSCWVPDDGRKDARNMFSRTQTSSNKLEKLLHLVG
jgi:hypothetical protein